MGVRLSFREGDHLCVLSCGIHFFLLTVYWHLVKMSVSCEQVYIQSQSGLVKAGSSRL